MTDTQKEILIERMLDKPADLSDSDIQAITSDAELKELYETAVQMRDALAHPREINTAKEWVRFVPRLLKQGRWSLKRIFRAAAIIIGAIFLSGADNNDIDII